MFTIVLVLVQIIAILGVIATFISLFYVYRLWKETRVIGFALFGGLLVLSIVSGAIAYIPYVQPYLLLMGMSQFGVFVQLLSVGSSAFVGAFAWRSIYRWIRAGMPTAAAMPS